MKVPAIYFQMVRGEGGREGEKRSIRQLEAGFPLQQYFYSCGCVCVCTQMCCCYLHVNGAGGNKDSSQPWEDKI